MDESSADAAGGADTADAWSERDETQVDANDTQPPHVISVSPVDRSAGVATRSFISVTFDAPIDTNTVTAETFKVVKDDKGAEEGVLSIAGTVVTFTPTHPLRMFNQYQVTLDASIADTLGNPTGKLYTFSFRTGDGAWATSIELSDGVVGQLGYISATNPVGDELVLFDDGQSRHLATFTEAGGWHASLAPNDVRMDHRAAMALAPSGNALVAWLEEPQGEYMPFFGYSPYSPTSGWAPTGTNTNLSDIIGVGIDDDDVGVMVVQYTNAEQSWTVADSLYKGVLHDNQLGASDDVTPFALDGAGNGIAVRRYLGQPYLDRYTRARGWRSEQPIDKATSCSDLAMNHAGDAFLFCRNGTSEMNVRRYQHATLSAPQTIDEFSLNPGKLVVAVNEMGDAVVIFRKETNGSLELWSMAYASGQWQNAMPIEATPDPNTEWAAGLDENGNAWVVWAEPDGNRNNLRAARSLAGMPWSPPMTVDRPHSGSASHPTLHMHWHGTATLLWTVQADQSSAPTTLWTTRFE